ncbi:glyoxalase domain-containing protein 4 [Lycorma delicatula]|uniref:glyoxalase domain-containing protein 4 n=1 Tax=Lycorma delicatula TaxID=130591 RepID=UPI003F5115EA
MVTPTARALHFVFKIGDRALTAKFYREILGMKVLRHEEFQEGCLAECNGPYNNRWSKTMVGYGPEESHFAVELTYNYNVDSYVLGNDFLGITIRSSEAIERAKANDWPVTEENGLNLILAPGGYKFFLIDEPQPTDKDPVEKVSLASTNLNKTIDFWNTTLGMIIYKHDDKSIVMGYGDDQVKLEYKHIDEPIDHATAYGRIAFSVPWKELENIDFSIRNADLDYKILVPGVCLDTPGKATVTVEIISDADGHEICFVDDENFRKLSEFDPESNAELDKYIRKDEARKEKQKAEAN